MGHGHDHASRRIGWTILLNIIITAAEYAGGIFSGSLALLSDAGHNLSDVLSLILGYFGEKVSERKPDSSYTFGMKRFELITSTINALALLLIGLYIIYESFMRYRSPEPIVLPVMIGVGAIGLVGNLLSILILNRDRERSMNMRAAYLHMFYDTISSVFVIVSGIVIYITGFSMFDILASFVIAVMIFWSSFGILRSSFHLIMQGVPEGISLDEVRREIRSVQGVDDMHSLHIWGINSNENYLSCHVCSDTDDYDSLIKTINSRLKRFNIENTSIQVEKNNICRAR